MGTLDQHIKDLHKKIVGVESHKRPVQEQKQTEPSNQKEYDIGRVTHVYEQNLNLLVEMPEEEETNMFSGEPNEEVIRLRKKALDSIEWYEQMIKSTKQRAAAAAGISSEEMDKYAQRCKQYYLEESSMQRKKREEYLKNIETVIHSDGSITEYNHNTGAIRKYDNDWNPLD